MHRINFPKHCIDQFVQSKIFSARPDVIIILHISHTARNFVNYFFANFFSVMNESEKPFFSISEMEDLHVLFVEEINFVTVSKFFINKYVQHRFAQYDVSDMQDRELWIKIRMNFEHFTNQHWRQIDGNFWTEILRFCYIHDFWVDWDMSVSTAMTKTVQNDYYYVWIRNQLKTIQQNYNITNKAMIRRMNDLNIQQNLNDQQQKIKSQIIISKNSPRGNLFDRSIYYFTLPSMKSGSRIFKNSNFYEFVYKSFQKRQSFQSLSFQDARKFDETRKFDEARKFGETRKFDETRKFERYSIYSFSDFDFNSDLDENNFHSRKYEEEDLSQYSCELIQLNKCYKNAEKFIEIDDNFEFKSSIFEEKCKRVDLFFNAYMLRIFIMLTESAFIFYYSHRKTAISYVDFCTKIQNFFEDLEWQRLNLIKWQTIIFSSVIAANPTLTTTECLRKMCTEMNKIQRNVTFVFQRNEHLKKNIIKTCRENATISTNFTNSSIDVSDLVNNLHASIINYETVYKLQTSAAAAADYVQKTGYLQKKNDDETYFVNRQFRRKQQYQNRDRERERNDRYPQTSRSSTFRKKRCFVCNRENCWSTNHTQQERDEANKRFGDRYPHFKARTDYTRKLIQYITDLKGSDDDEITQYFEKLQIDFEPTKISATFNVQSYENDEVFCISLDTLKNSDCILITNLFIDHAAKHQIIDIDESESSFSTENSNMSYAYISSTSFKYDDTEFKNLLINSNSATRSTGGIGQLKALQKIDDTIQLNQSTAGSANFVFDIESTGSIESINISTSIELITFHIISVNTFFLLCLANLNKSETFFNNVTNKVIQQKFPKSHLVFRRYGHAFLLWNILTYVFIDESIIQHPCFLTETEIRRLHRRFGHFSVQRFYQILDRADHEVDQRIIQHFIKYCHHCQKHGRFSDRFNFTIKKNIDFNFHIIVDIFYIEKKSVLHFIDETTRFQTGRWLKNITAKNVWNQLKACWIDIYLEFSDLISADAEKQFVAQKFRHYASNMKIMMKNVSVETHHFIDQIERYHDLLRRVYLIIASEILEIDPDLNLQMALKTINDSIESHGLVPTLLMFGAYSRMTELDAFSPTINQRAIAMKKAMNEMRKLNVNRQINDVFNTRNESSTIHLHDLPLNSFILVYREGPAGRSGIWKESFNLINIENESAILNLSNGSIKFRTISMKSYHDFFDLGIDDSFNDENSRISDVFDFFEHPIFPETNGENSKHPFFSETNVENRSFFNDDSAIQSIRRDRRRSRKQISKKNFIFTFDIYSF